MGGQTVAATGGQVMEALSIPRQKDRWQTGDSGCHQQEWSSKIRVRKKITCTLHVQTKAHTLRSPDTEGSKSNILCCAFLVRQVRATFASDSRM
jgi:hypothetical protein